MEIIGTLSSILLMLCSIPAVLDTMRRGYCRMNIWFVTIWMIGEILGLVYVSTLANWPLILNYGWNSLATFYLLINCREDTI
jgi:hypothetical protein